MEQEHNQNFVTVPVRSVGMAEQRQLMPQQHQRRQSSDGHHRKNQHSISSQPSASQQSGVNARMNPNSNILSHNSAHKNTAQPQGSANGSSAKKQQQLHRRKVTGTSSLHKDGGAAQSAAGGLTNNYGALSLENSFKDGGTGPWSIMMGQSQTAQQSLHQQAQRGASIGGQENAPSQQNRDVSEVVGGEGLSPINGQDEAATAQKAQAKASQQVAERAPSKKEGSDEAKRQQMRQMKNLQKLQKSGQSRKKSSQFGKSNKILLMSGTKSKMMELSGHANRAADKSMTMASGSIAKGTATLIELGRVNSVAPDLSNQDGVGPQGASQTYNNASKLLASAGAGEIDMNVSDYGGDFKQNKSQSKQTISVQQRAKVEDPQLMLTISEDNDIQGPDGGVPVISVFDQLEEMQFMSYELGTKLHQLVQTIIQHSAGYNQYMDGEGLMVQPDTWEIIQSVAKEANNDFEMIQEQLRQFFDRMQDEVSKWKRRCSKLQTRLQSAAAQTTSNMPPKPMGMSRSQGRHAKNAAGPILQSQSNVRITISGNGGRKGAIKQSSSLNHSGMQSKKERLMLEKSLIEIVNVYDKNRTQIYSNLEEMESRVNEFKNTREKLSVQHMGTMTTVEQEMEQLCLRSARSQKSGQNLKSQSHRSHSASKRPMNSFEASRRSSRMEADLANQKSSIDRRESNLNTPIIMNSGAKQRPKAMSSGVRSPTDAGSRAHSLVPPLPIHMINNLNKDQSKSKKLQHPNVQPHYQQQAQNSARSAHSKPPPPESYRSHRGKHSHRSRQDPGQLSRQSQQRSSGQVDSMGNSSQQNITGAIVNGHLVNNVMLQANNKIATSKFEKDLENSFEGDDATLIFDTERLKQFSEDYACYAALESTDQKILVKQWLFMKHERELKQQAKHDKQMKEQRRKERLAQQKAEEGANPKKRRQHSQSTGSMFNASNRSYRSGPSNANMQYNQKNNRDVELGQILDISAIQLDSSLSDIGTIEKLKARAKEQNLEAQLSEMLAVSQNISGLKTVTQKDLVQLAEKHWQAHEQLRQEDRKVLQWSNDGEEDEHTPQAEQSHEKILAGLSREEPYSSQPVSPSQINMQFQLPSRAEPSANNNSSHDEANHMEQEPSPIKPNPDSSQPHCDSFINDSSLVYEDFDQLTPQQVRAIQQNPARGQKVSMAPGNNSSAPPAKKAHQPGLFAEQSNINVGNYGDDSIAEAGRLAVKAPHQMELMNGMNSFANATSNSDEESLLFQNQKKSLEVITERQSEFSNTMGTFARPSQRSKQSKNQSSNAKHNGTRGGHSAIINGSAASLNNSSANINSSRYRKQQANNNGGGNGHLQSFVDIADQDPHDESKSFISRMSKHGKGDSAAKINTHSSAHVDQSVPQVNETEQTVLQSEVKRQEHTNQPGNGDTSAQFTDMAAHTPMRHLGGGTSDARKQPATQSNQQNVTRQQIAYKHLMYELRGNAAPGVDQVQHQSATVLPSNLRQKQQELLQGESVHSSYVDNSCYIDESSIKSSSVEQGLSSVKKHRKQKHLHAQRQGQTIPNERPQRQQMAKSPGFRRSSSEIYIKNTSMQNDEDAHFVPIVYAMEQSQQSLQQSTDATKIKIDQSQLNNLTRYLEANNSAWRQGSLGQDSHATFLINNTLQDQLQRLFMQHQTQGTDLQDLKAGRSNSLKFSFSKSVGKVAGGQQTVENPSILKPNTFGITSSLNESIADANNLQKRTLIMLNHLQGLKNHHLNPSVGLIFSHSSGQLRASSTANQRQQRGLSPSTEHRNGNIVQALLKKTTTSPIEDYFNNNIFNNKTDLKRNLQEGLPPPMLIRHPNDLVEPTFMEQADLLDRNRYKSEVVTKLGHVREPSRETVSSYVTQAQAMRQATAPSHNQSVTLSSNSQSAAKAHAYSGSGSGKLMIKSTGVSSANVKTGSKQVNQQLLQKSLIAYQSTDFNQQREPKSDYVDQSMVSLSALGGAPSNSLSIMSKSVERVSGAENQSMASAQSNLQRKLRLKTSKQYKVITERSSASKGLKPRPASSMATSTLNHSIKNASSRQGSEGRSTNPSGGGVVNISAISAVPTSTQFKILQMGSGGKGSNSSVTRDQSNSSSNRLQLQSQPQITKQQLQLKLQQQQSLVSQIGNYVQGSNNSETKIESQQQQRGPVLKRINIKKIPSVKRGAAENSHSKSAAHQSGIHLRNARHNQQSDLLR